MSHVPAPAASAAPPSSITPVNPSSDDLLTTKDLQRMLHCSDESVRRMRSRADGIPFVRLSRAKILYRRSDVEAWLASHVTAPCGA